MLLGAHVSIAGGIDKSIDRGTAIGADCIQTFASPPRTLSFYPYSSEIKARYKQLKQDSSIKLHVFHGVYLVNLASEKSDYVKASINSLVQYQQTASDLGVIGTIFHIGSHKGMGFDTVKQQIAHAIQSILHESPTGTLLMLENAAGHKGTVGQNIDELAEIFDIVDHKEEAQQKLGICLDTQHAFASGVDARDKESLNKFIDLVDQKIGISAIKVIHANDSKVAFDSHKDRHENVGQGELGNIGLKNWLTHPKLQHLPFILEVPGIEGSGPGKADLEALKNLL